MYLERADIEATLTIISRRSAPGSHLTIAYISPALIRWIAGLAVRRLGEPFRSVFRQNEMQALLARHGFTVRTDEDISTIASRLSPELGRDARAMKHLRIATAEKAR